MERIEITIAPDGTARAIYSDALRPFMAAGEATIRRASHVEPTADGRWEADMAPVGGPVLGPFEERAAALDAEVAWLREHVL